MIVSTYESRPFDLTGVKLLVVSLARHCHDLPVEFSCPKLDTDFARWLARFPHVHVRERPELERHGWNIKPTLLLELLEAGHDEVLWIDADVIVHRDFRRLLAGLPHDTLVSTEEPDWGQDEGGTHRTVSWGLVPARDMERTVNSAVLRVTAAHRELLRRWRELLETSDYRAAQARPWYERPIHLLGDQEVLTALLASSEFAHVPVRLLRRGRDILQSFSPTTYTLRERLHNGLHGLPPLVHAMRQKPWRYSRMPSLAREPRRYYHLVYLELSPYTHVARAYRDELGEDADWMDIRTVPAKVLQVLAGGSVNLQGVPHVLIGHALRPLRRLARRIPGGVGPSSGRDDVPAP
ncbi:MAG: nucleotide-diphospho-sugar transferase [Actinomycetota bacterium]|nr:nucleotide-diphospho-sugar transferase [Actinomycetota bacterium]